MAKHNKRELIKNYFKPYPTWTLKFMCAGVFMVFAAIYVMANPEFLGGGCSKVLAKTFFEYPLGFLMVCLGVGLFTIGIIGWFFDGHRPSDEKMDSYIYQDLSNAIAKSLEKTDFDESELVGDPLPIFAPRFWNTAGADILHKKGKDNVLRFSPIDVTVLHLTQHQIVTYQACLDLTTGNLLNESAEEYFYKDVVSVSTKTQSKSYPSDEFGIIQLNAAETFVLTTSGGTSVEVILKDPKLIEMMGGGDLPPTDVERTIKSVRKMLREKKQDVPPTIQAPVKMPRVKKRELEG